MLAQGRGKEVSDIFGSSVEAAEDAIKKIVREKRPFFKKSDNRDQFYHNAEVEDVLNQAERLRKFEDPGSRGRKRGGSFQGEERRGVMEV